MCKKLIKYFKKSGYLKYVVGLILLFIGLLIIGALTSCSTILPFLEAEEEATAVAVEIADNDKKVVDDIVDIADELKAEHQS